MLESRLELKLRLKKEGKWNEFVQLRDKFKTEGYEPKVAYALAARKFSTTKAPGSSSGKSDSSDGSVRVRLEQFAGKKKVNTRKIVEWVFDNIDVEDAVPEQAPCPGAWSLLQRVRQFPDLLKEFYRSIWVRTLPSKTETEHLHRFEDDGREQLNLISRIEKARDSAVLSSGSKGCKSESKVQTGDD